MIFGAARVNLSVPGDGLSVEEFADYGPVQLFRNAFLKGWYQLLVEVASRRHLNAL